MRVRRFWLVGQIVGALLLCGLGGGCGGTDRPKAPLPKLQPVRGQLLRAGQPVSGGSLRLEPIAAQSPAPGGQNLSIAGTVGPDGRFELVTLQTLSMQSGPGAPVGQYRATYYPPPSERPEDQAALQPITLPEPVTIQEGPNELKLSLDRPKTGKQ